MNSTDFKKYAEEKLAQQQAEKIKTDQEYENILLSIRTMAIYNRVRDMVEFYFEAITIDNNIIHLNENESKILNLLKDLGKKYKHRVQDQCLIEVKKSFAVSNQSTNEPDMFYGVNCPDCKCKIRAGYINVPGFVPVSYIKNEICSRLSAFK